MNAVATFLGGMAAGFALVAFGACLLAAWLMAKARE